MNVLAIFAGPRKNGLVDRMLRLATDAAEQSGHTVKTICLYEKNIRPCTGCMRCRNGEDCPVDDDFPVLRDDLLHCGAVIVAAPTYFANVPGPLKTLFDRLAGAVMRDGPHGVPQGKLSKYQGYQLLTACTTPAPFDFLCGQSRGALRAMQEVFHTAGMHRLGTAVCAGSRGKTGLSPRLENRIRRVWR